MSSTTEKSSSSLCSSSFFPSNITRPQAVAYSFLMGFLLKWNDILGDREILLTEEQFQVAALISTIFYCVIMSHFSLINMELYGMTLGSIVGCLLGGKLDVYVHVVPSIVIPIFHLFIFFFYKNAKWHGIDFSGSWAKKLLVVFGHVCFIATVDEITHELFEDHPNDYIRLFFDRRLFSDVYTAIVLFLSTKKLLPFGLSDACNWNAMFLCPLTFGWGYDLLRASKPAINAYLSS